MAYESILMEFTTYEDSVELTLDYSTPLENLLVTVEEGDSYEYYGNGSLFHLTFLLSGSGTHIIEMNYETEEFSIIDDGKMIYSPTFSFPVTPKYFRCRLFLEDGMSITSPLVPSPDRVYSKGNDIIVSWENISTQSSFYILCAIGTIPSSGHDWYLLLLVIPAVVIGYYICRLRRKDVKVLKPGFKTDEELVIKLLEDGKQTHKELVDATGFSKSKITRILKEFEDRDVIRREKYKNRDIIHLK
ncbi:MAG TPA: winged helix-turn-helix transcriptional regulator [Candidatus Methanofastidiosa archaeon]|nr:winged helix-turn-helix transcriptional regulator [Candidatus Methanofastidiosa archaeon]HPR41502.1 winged helix-turn-helix transcriptional regulator [Candidatus Methanofastidiosa archaeon]